MLHVPRPARLHYRWVILAVTGLTVLMAAGVTAVPAVLIHPLEVEFGWNRAAIALAVSINVLLYGLAGPFAGGLMLRFGPRRVMLTSLVLIACGVAATTQLRSLLQLYLLWGVVVGIGHGEHRVGAERHGSQSLVHHAPRAGARPARRRHVHGSAHLSAAAGRSRDRPGLAGGGVDRRRVHHPARAATGGAAHARLTGADGAARRIAGGAQRRLRTRLPPTPAPSRSCPSGPPCAMAISGGSGSPSRSVGRRPTG